MTRRAVVTQAQIERVFKAAKVAGLGKQWRIRITSADILVEPTADEPGSPSEPQVDESEDLVL